MGPILFADNSNINPNIDFSPDRFEVVEAGLIVSKLERKYPEPINFDQEIETDTQVAQVVIKDGKTIYLNKTGQVITDLLKNAGFDSGYISDQPFIDLNLPLPVEQTVESVEVSPQTPEESVQLDLPQPLSDIIPKPANPQFRNFLRYPKYNINVPVIYSSFEDLFENNPDGTINFSRPRDNDPIGSPIQVKLRDGIVHMAFTPQPGELGNSYIVGHSSNYSSVRSNYNTVFKPIESRSKPGEEFIIYDRFGRELKFRVFEAIKIAAEDGAQAYKNYPDKRVVTLQTSVLTLTRNGYQATHRWLTRGELVT
ncbi:MAG: sortase [Patescibacteria group bacterium]